MHIHVYMYAHTCVHVCTYMYIKEKRTVSMFRAELLRSLCTGSQEGCSRIYRCLSQLLCLCELEEAGGEERR